MNPKFMNAPEREAYRMGYERGKQEAVELRKIFTERGDKRE